MQEMTGMKIRKITLFHVMMQNELNRIRSSFAQSRENEGKKAILFSWDL